MNCTFAQNHCKTLYKDMSIVSDNEDLQMLEEAAGGTYPISWINSQENSCKSLKYEDTKTSVANQRLWKKPSCLDKIPFFCYENFILVQENKTWEEALEFCRTHYTDLAYFNFRWPVNQIKNETNITQTDSVWTGLRFLHGTWNWLNMRNAQNDISLPPCPPEPYRCGARNTKTEQWENRDCEEKLNFLCLKK
ncbi:hypothetical protein PO909_015355 [Leuciscus waleckii]